MVIISTVQSIDISFQQISLRIIVVSIKVIIGNFLILHYNLFMHWQHFNIETWTRNQTLCCAKQCFVSKSEAGEHSV